MPESLGPGHAAVEQAGGAVGLLGRGEASGTPRSTTTTRCSTAKAGSGWRRRSAGPTTRPSARRAPIIRRPRRSRSRRTSARSRCSIRKTMKYTFVDTCFGTHHLQFGYDANDTLWTSGGGAGGRLGQHQDVRRDRRRREVAGLDAVRARHQRQRQARRIHRAQPAGRSAKDMRITGGSGTYAVMPNPADGSIWVRPSACSRDVGGVMRLRSRTRSWPKSTTSRCRASARAAATSTARAWCGSRSPAATSAASTAASARAAQRPEGDRRSLPRRLVVLPVSGSGLPGHRREQRRVELLLLGRPAQHVRARRGRADVDRQPEDGLVALKDGKMVAAARAVSAGLLRQGLRRPHRRSERRLEGPRAVGGERRPHAVADRRRQGHASRWPRTSSFVPIRWRSKRTSARRSIARRCGSASGDFIFGRLVPI